MLELLWGIARIIWGGAELIYEFFGGGSDRVQKKRARKQIERAEQLAKQNSDADG